MFDYEKELDMSHLCALILTPTRELAIQVSEHLKAIAVYTPIKVMALVGGISVQKQERLLAKRPQVVVATPGRLWEMISTVTHFSPNFLCALFAYFCCFSNAEQGKEHLTDLSGLRFLVLDEADRMIETGHFPEVSSILQHVNSFGCVKTSFWPFLSSLIQCFVVSTASPILRSTTRTSFCRPRKTRLVCVE
jgi:ATP-dependent RNA helicase DDX24/MAK5